MPSANVMERFERSGTVVDPRQTLAMWLRAGRVRRKLSLDDVARITKIQVRILEKLEMGQLDGLPADVFVRGFVRSFARCAGLDENEALSRYAQCAQLEPRRLAEPTGAVVVKPVPNRAPERSTGPSAGSPASAFVPMPEAALEVSPLAEASAVPVMGATASRKKKRGRRRKAAGTGAPMTKSTVEISAITPVATAPTAVEASPDPAAPPAVAVPQVDVEQLEAVIAEGSGGVEACEVEAAPPPVAAIEVATVEPGVRWKPTMPPLTSSPPWRRPAFATIAPSLVIDDADPDRAEREQDAKTASKMRSPSVSGDGVTMIDRGGCGAIATSVKLA
jgi:cytoskeletal protein RodZ